MSEDVFRIITDRDMTYEEAAEYFKGKLDLTPKEFYGLQAKYRSQAFTVSGYSSLKMIQAFHDELTKALEDGISMGEFKRSMDDFLERNGYTKLHPLQAENIFRTNVQTAYNVGAYEEMTRPAVMKARPYWRYDAVEDSRTRPAHRAMNGKVFPADSPVWDTWYPPNGFRCRCSVSTLSKRQVEQQGLKVEEKVPDRISTGMDMIPMIPDKNFNYNPAKTGFKPDLSDVPEPLRKAFERHEAQHRVKPPTSQAAPQGG